MNFVIAMVDLYAFHLGVNEKYSEFRLPAKDISRDLSIYQEES